MKKLLIGFILVFAGYFSYLYLERPTAIIPYPYQLKLSRPVLSSTPNVVILGDRMAQRLERYIPTLTENTSKNLQRPLNILSLAGEHEGLHRSLAKLKMINPAPGLVIYHGATEEYFEKRFVIQDRDTIFHNFKTYKDERYLSLLMTFPILSKFIYRGTNIYHLGDKIKANTTEYPAPQKLVQMEIEQKLYEQELNELVVYCRERGIPLMMITTPLNLQVGPKKVCPNAISATLLNEQEDIQLLLNDGDAKSAYAKAKTLLEAAPGNALSYHLLGQVLAKLGRFKEARVYLENSTAFDCETWRGNVLFNNMQRRLAEKNELPLIDFDDLVNQNYGKNILFLDELFPQELYYEQLMEIIQRSIIKSLKI